MAAPVLDDIPTRSGVNWYLKHSSSTREYHAISSGLSLFCPKLHVKELRQVFLIISSEYILKVNSGTSQCTAESWRKKQLISVSMHGIVPVVLSSGADVCTKSGESGKTAVENQCDAICNAIREIKSTTQSIKHPSNDFSVRSVLLMTVYFLSVFQRNVRIATGRFCPVHQWTTY